MHGTYPLFSFKIHLEILENGPSGRSFLLLVNKVLKIIKDTGYKTSVLLMGY